MLVDLGNKTKEGTTVGVGDFIYAKGKLRVITKISEKYYAIYVEGGTAFAGAGYNSDSIYKVVAFYKADSDFKLIKANELKIVRV